MPPLTVPSLANDRFATDEEGFCILLTFTVVVPVPSKFDTSLALVIYTPHKIIISLFRNNWGYKLIKNFIICIPLPWIAISKISIVAALLPSTSKSY